MVFPSTGCETCKIRRIKRCLKARRVCYGMGALAAVHIENSYASGVKKRPRGPRSVLRKSSNIGFGSTLSGDCVELKTRAILYYYSQHLKAPRKAPKVLKALSEDYLLAWIPKLDSPIIDLAVSCMALAVFSRRYKYQPAAIEASLNYQHLLQVARTSIPSLVNNDIDTCLISIFFMSRYEDVVYEPRDDIDRQVVGPKSFRHHDGALSILKMWKNHLSVDQPATDIMKYTRRGMIKSALLRKQGLPAWIVDGSTFGERGLELEYDRIVVRLANLRHEIFVFFGRHGEFDRTKAEQLAQEARDIDKTLEHWALHFPSTWSYQRFTLPDHGQFPTSNFFSASIYSYSSIAHAAVWNQYYSTRMLSLSTRIRILESEQFQPLAAVERELAECASSADNMAIDFASSLPYSLERFKLRELDASLTPDHSIIQESKEDIRPYFSSMTIWPLSLATNLENIENKQVLWLRSRLADLGRMSGYGMLESLATTPWLRL
ncbi:hypothetical protein PV08_06557 [Exophiala spinifera]|uniref:Transcription factor domain-containing protein n=1 Tax=Exophiala spinifera TaxID=91928 RepID=A0A0D1ZUX3_9EURO|nr:uncharacterized protein PV08_06557 [Exophiala spinifera]KIW16502.1 hypothetical protein PV08_06557 [Exophiala spinifera]